MQIRETIKEMLGKIQLISEGVTSENEEIASLDETVAKIHTLAEDIGNMAEAMYK